jgi:hypothetical protein
MSGYLKPAHYVLYWKITPEERLNLAGTKSSSYAASNLLARVKPGDVLWIVNVYLGRLLVIGRIAVEVVVDNIEVAQELVGSYPGDWIEADWYAIANKHNVEPLREVDLTPVLGLIQFDSKIASSVFTIDNRVDATQFRTLRRITMDTAKLFEEVWYADEYTPQTVQDYLELTEDDAAYAEGRTVVRTLRQRMRNRNLVDDAKALFRANHGNLHCQVCGFDFGAFYGIEYIEAHHIRQMAGMEEDNVSSIEDLVMLCANCHRIAHQRTPPYTIDELKAFIRANRGH